MEVVVEYVFAGLMVFMLLTACLAGLNSYANFSLQKLNDNSLQSFLSHYLLSILAPNGKACSHFIQKLSVECRSICSSSYLPYDELQMLLGVTRYGLTLTIKPSLQVSLQLKGRELYCTVVNSITSAPFSADIFLYAFNENGRVDRICIRAAGGCGYYKFGFEPKLVVAFAVDGEFFGFNYTGIFKEVEAAAFNGALFFTSIPLGYSKYLLAEGKAGGARTENVLFTPIIFYSQAFDSTFQLYSGFGEARLFLSGFGQVRLEIGIANRRLDLIRSLVSNVVNVSSHDAKCYSIKLHFVDECELSEGDRIYVKIVKMSGSVKFHFSGEQYPSLVVLPSSLPIFHSGIYIKLPLGNYSYYALSPIESRALSAGYIKDFHVDGIFKLNYSFLPLILVAYSSNNSSYYVASVPPLPRLYGGVRSEAFHMLKSIFIGSYLYIVELWTWPYNLDVRVEENAFTIKAYPHCVNVTAGGSAQVRIDVMSFSEFREVNVSLYASSSFPYLSINLSEISGITPFSIMATIIADQHAPPGTYAFYVKGISEGGFTAYCEVEVNVLPKSNSSFSILLFPSKVEVDSLDEVKIEVHINPINDYQHPVEITAENVPIGFNVTFNPERAIPPFNSTCTIQTSSASSGEYKILIKGVGDDGMESFSLLTVLVLGEVKDFNLTVLPKEVEISRSGAVLFKVLITPIGGFNDVVEVTVNDLPPFSIFLLRPARGRPPFNSTLIIYVSKLTPSKVYWVTILGSSSSIRHEFVVKLVVGRGKQRG